MKKGESLFLLLLVIAIGYTGCTQEEISLSEVSLSNPSEFKLVSKRKLNTEEAGGLRSIYYDPVYERSEPIYRYLYYGDYNNLDHFYATENASSLTHHGRVYNFERQEFNLMSGGTKTQKLYRHYSSSLNDHMLSISSSENSYTSEGSIGAVFTSQEIGTVPLKEYYSSQRKSHLYIVRNAELDWIYSNDPDFVYVKTLGYVYPGQAIDSKKIPTEFIVKGVHGSFFLSTKVTLNLKVREGDAYWDLSYSAQIEQEGQSVTLPINNTYTVVEGDIVFQNSSATVTVFDITNPENEYDILSFPPGSVIFYERFITDYKVLINFKYDIILGTE